MQTIYFAVTTDLNYDQRMQRICTSLSDAGYRVVLVGRKRKKSTSLKPRNYEQKRLSCFFEKGKLFYAEYNLRLFMFLLFKKMDAICAIDLDTIIPCYYIAQLKKCKRIYDAHELFCEMKEIVTRPSIYSFWKKIERKFVPYFPLGYTVNSAIAEEFKQMYKVDYAVIRNMAKHKNPEKRSFPAGEKYFYYQGAVNEGRAFETLFPAMLSVDAKLIICGDGNFMTDAKEIVSFYKLTDKVKFMGMLEPEELTRFATNAFAGLTLFENKGKSNYYSLANRFFDYVQAGIPQICVDYPVYLALNKKYEIALLINNTDVQTISENMNRLLQDTSKWEALQHATVDASKAWSWEQEATTLIKYYQEIVFK